MNQLERRDFFKLAALATGGFILGIGAKEKNARGEEAFQLNAFIEINSAGDIILTAHKPEIGQGVKTSLPMLLAEELDVPWETVQVRTRVVDKNLFGRQGAGGSQSVRQNYMPLRQLGAAAKMMLIKAAANKWGVPAGQCEAREGRVFYQKKELSYAELAEAASRLTPPQDNMLKLKDEKDFKIIGKRIGGVDNQAIVTGEPLFGIDQSPEGVKYAAFIKCPFFTGEVKKANVSEVKNLPGVRDAFVIEAISGKAIGLSSGVAIIADSTWQAFQASKKLKVDWRGENMSQHHDEEYAKQAQLAIEKDKEKKLPQGALEATYYYPFIAHNTMEPQNCTALYDKGVLEMWAPTQSPNNAANKISKLLQLDDEKIRIHVVRSGGGFGRRLHVDFMIEAAAIASRCKGVPVKVTWTRDQDLQHDYYRLPAWHYFTGNVDSAGEIETFADHVVTLGLSENKPGIGGRVGKGGFPFAFIHPRKASTKSSVVVSHVPGGFWRAPGANGNAFAIQSFVDELAYKAGKDPLEFRQAMLEREPRGKRYQAERMRGVLEAVKKKSNWGKKLPKGSAQGVAFYFSHQGYVAVVAEVTVSKAGKLSVNKMTAAVDVGKIVNPSGAENQVVGSMLDGLSAAWQQKISVKEGEVQNSNFHDYPVLRMQDVPKTEVVFIESDNPPTGLGEPALPPAPPAICNAIFAATGVRVRSLPIRENDLSWG